MKLIEANRINDVNTTLVEQVNQKVSELSNGDIDKFTSLIYSSDFWESLLLNEAGEAVAYSKTPTGKTVDTEVNTAKSNILSAVNKALSKAVVTAKRDIKDML